MTSQSDLTSLSPKDRREYGFARVRDAAFDAVSALWARRQNEGMTQVDIANALGSDPGWVSKNLRGPGNWTLRTFGAFVEALNGEAQITISALDDPPQTRPNYHAYIDYEPTTSVSVSVVQSSPSSLSVSGPTKTRGVNTAVLVP
jgi:hypothetical protein